jgi:hypothetical protein
MDDPQPRTNCRRPDKTAYPTRRAAKKAARYLTGKGARFSVYACSCGRFHLGNSTADERTRIRETG